MLIGLDAHSSASKLWVTEEVRKKLQLKGEVIGKSEELEQPEYDWVWPGK